jgi:nicotinamidase-related amidase
MDTEPAMDGPPSDASVDACPYPFTFDPATTALVIIDMQRDFLEPEGFGETLGNDVSLLAPVVPAVKSLLDAARTIGMKVIHTREGHRPDLTDLHEAKRIRGNPTLEIGDVGPKGRILIRGEFGHDIIDELAPITGEAVIDKPGKGAFYATDLGLMLAKDGITSLIVTGVTTEVCVHTTVREANDRGFECLVVEDGTGSYFPDFHAMALKMIAAQGGIFGWTATSTEILAALPGISTTTTSATLPPSLEPDPTPVTTGA